MKNPIKPILRWIFKTELRELNEQLLKTKKATAEFEAYKMTLDNLLKNIDVSVDVSEHHRYSRSWAVISVQGSRTDFLKFVDLGDSEIRDIQRFLRQFTRCSDPKIDASPGTTPFFRLPRKR